MWYYFSLSHYYRNLCMNTATSSSHIFYDTNKHYHITTETFASIQQPLHPTSSIILPTTVTLLHKPLFVYSNLFIPHLPWYYQPPSHCYINLCLYTATSSSHIFHDTTNHYHITTETSVCIQPPPHPTSSMILTNTTTSLQKPLLLYSNLFIPHLPWYYHPPSHCYINLCLYTATSSSILIFTGMILTKQTIRCAMNTFAKGSGQHPSIWASCNMFTTAAHTCRNKSQSPTPESE